jgi:hypothetical protein
VSTVRVGPERDTALLRRAVAAPVKRKPRGEAQALQNRLTSLGWLAPVPGFPSLLAITVTGEAELLRRL